MTRDPRLLSALLIAALVVGACGSDGDSGVDEADSGLRDAEDARSEELVPCQATFEVSLIGTYL
jgi:hypothetical protein